MKNIYVVHTNEYSDSENIGAFTNEKDAIDIIKQIDKAWNQYNFHQIPGAHLKKYKDNFDGTTFFDIAGKNVPRDLTGDEAGYEKVPLNDASATKYNYRHSF